MPEKDTQLTQINTKLDTLTTLLSNQARPRRIWPWALAILLVFWVGSAVISSKKLAVSAQDHIARFTVDGMIMEDAELEAKITSLAENDRVKAVIVHVNSPGGSMVGGLNMYNAIRKVAEVKPVSVVMGTVAASAGYMISLAGDYIVASEGTLTGSIGVFMPLVDATALGEKVGIRADDIVSGELKAVTSPLQKRDKQAKIYLNRMVGQMNKVFQSYVTSRRELSPETLEIISDGRAIVGVEAKNLNLVDALGDISTAKEWLINKRGVSAKLPVITLDIEKDKNLFEKLMTSAHLLPINLGLENKQGFMALLRL